MDCTSKIIKKVYEPQFSSARTKSEAILENVFSKFALKELTDELSKSAFIDCDASNHGDLKLFPILVRYFHEDKGICVKLLELENKLGETSKIISNYIIQTLKRYDLSDKLFGFCADNANTNFGGALRKGTNNVYAKLQSEFNFKIVGIGCAAHILHNTLQTAADTLPFDIQSIIMKIYSYFHIYTVRVETLKDFCNYVGTEYHAVLGYSKTRWLALLPALERLISMFLPLKNYFLSLSNCPILLRKFFENEFAEVWLCFLHKQVLLFNNAVKEVEGQNTTVLAVSNILQGTLLKMKSRLDDKFIPLEIDSILCNSDSNCHEIKNDMFSFYDVCVQYLERWTKQFDDFVDFSWLNLDCVPTWNNVTTCLKYVTNIKNEINVDDSELHDEFTYIKQLIDERKLIQWKKDDVTVDARWCEIFSKMKTHHVEFKNIFKLVSCILCIPGSNAPTERVFSLVNNVWTAEKTSLHVSTLRALMIVKVNLAYSCEEFYSLLINDKILLKEIHSSMKYKDYACK